MRFNAGPLSLSLAQHSMNTIGGYATRAPYIRPTVIIRTYPMPPQCWVSVANDGPTAIRQWFSASHHTGQ